MDVLIRLEDGTVDELVDLAEWLSAEAELRGQVRIVHPPIEATELGSIPELLSIALGAGGAGSILASSLKTWLMARRTRAKLTIEADGRLISLDIATTAEVSPLLEQILNAVNHK